MATATVERDQAEGYEPAGDEDAAFVVEGASQLSFAVGGERPSTASLRLVGGKVDIEGQFSKGERIVLRVECEVREVSFRDETDKATGQTVGCERRHKAAITGVHRLEAE